MLKIHEPGVGLEAVVVIDHLRFPVSAGGTRMAPGVTEEEVARLARAMTWKFAVYELPVAGAKGGIDYDGGGGREAMLAAYKDAIRPLGGIFLTGPDMGTSADDFLPEDGERPMWARTFRGRNMDDLATGKGVAAAARVALERRGAGLGGATVAIEGFGKAGSGSAIAFAEAGARVVAVSTVAGALVDEAGLDVDLLLALRDEHGDHFVRVGPDRRERREAVFATPCDVLVPGARTHVITPKLAGSLRCTVVCPAANAPFADGATDVLHRRGILAVPDFVANAGGVHLYEAEECASGTDPAACLAGVTRRNEAGTRRVLDRAETDGVPPMEAALRLAKEFLASAAA